MLKYYILEKFLKKIDFFRYSIQIRKQQLRRILEQELKK